MKKLHAVMLWLALALPASADETSLRLELSGLDGAAGNVHIAVYDNPDDWLGENTVTASVVDIEAARDGELVVAELSLPPGNYAISIFYDKNNNGELDSNFIGIPKEPVALSNNAKAKFGPPKYKDAVFALGEEGLTQRIAITAI